MLQIDSEDLITGSQRLADTYACNATLDEIA
jgi:hypothetical protein